MIFYWYQFSYVFSSQFIEQVTSQNNLVGFCAKGLLQIICHHLQYSFSHSHCVCNTDKDILLKTFNSLNFSFTRR